MSRVYLPEDPDFLDPLPGDGPVISQLAVLRPSLTHHNSRLAHFDQISNGLAFHQPVGALLAQFVEGGPTTAAGGRIAPCDLEPGQHFQSPDVAGVPGEPDTAGGTVRALTSHTYSVYTGGGGLSRGKC